MLVKYLQQANNVLKTLIELTEEDIADIKQANHDNIFERNKQKEQLLQNFLSLKAEIDSLIASKMRVSQNDFLTNEEDNLLDELKNNLEILHKKNKLFGSLAIAVKGFFTTLLDKFNNNSKQQFHYDQQPTSNNSYFMSLKG